MFWFKKTYTIHVFQAADGWRFHAKAGNNEIIFQSESYTRKEDAERAARMVEDGRFVAGT